MPYRELTLDPPFVVLAGDRFPVDRSTSTIYQIRGTAIVDSRVVSFPGALIGETPAAESDGVFGRILIWEEKKVPGTNVSITGIRIGSNDAVLIDWSDGTQTEIADMAALGAIADEVDADPSFAKKILEAMAYRASPDGSNLGSMVGAQVAVNCASGIGDPVVYTAP